MQVADLDAHRPSLLAHCYRMLGGLDDAEDAVQEAMIRAWRHRDGYAGRAPVRAWLLTIATRACLDALAGRRRRGLPTALPGPADPTCPPPDAWDADAWVDPFPDAAIVDDPGDRLARRQTVRLAFVAALQRLPPRRRAVLLLREVVGWSATDVALRLDMSPAAVHSALQRARATLAAAALPPDDPADDDLLSRYVAAFEAYDVDALVDLLHADATLSMPPYPMWLQGHEAIRAWLLGLGVGCRGSRLLPTRASGAPAFGQYRRDGAGWSPWSLIVLDVRAGRVAAMRHHLDVARLFPRFGLPPTP